MGSETFGHVTRLMTIGKLAELHKTALKTLCQKYEQPGAVAYETMAEELASAMMSIAIGVDPVGSVVDLALQWRALAEDADDTSAAILTAWALTIEKTLDE